MRFSSVSVMTLPQAIKQLPSSHQLNGRQLARYILQQPPGRIRGPCSRNGGLTTLSIVEMPSDNGEQLHLSRRRIELGNQLRQPLCNAPFLGSTSRIASSKDAVMWIVPWRCAESYTVHFGPRNTNRRRI